MTQVWFKARDGRKYWIDRLLVQKLDNVKKIIKKNWDCVVLVDGRERSGKSTLGITCAYYLDPNLTINNFAKGTKDAIEKIEKLPDKSVMVIDEGSLLFNSKDAMAKEQKRLMKILDVVGQKNMTFIVILPSIFNLSRDIVTRRARFLLHVYTDNNLNRGRFGFYGEKKLPALYDKGKKSFNKYTLGATFYGRFHDFNPFGEDYLQTKRETLMLALHEDDKKESAMEKKFKERLATILHYITKHKNIISQKELSEELRRVYQLSLSQPQIARITAPVKAIPIQNA